ncbi:hypothetical protein F7725_021503 [Dissostichus mawsoni]|uniref:Uncharacterized protein n=1 Tax=Dissostichus mawsoni TaxID=36200 RepID=A0A7J5ZBE3_DISMA|nr:hypothetical protein F7725_021503 [Dissostichus mawsoni]
MMTTHTRDVPTTQHTTAMMTIPTVVQPSLSAPAPPIMPPPTPLHSGVTVGVRDDGQPDVPPLCPQSVGHLAGVRPRVGLCSVHDDEELVGRCEEVALSHNQWAVVFCPVQPGEGAATGDALQDRSLPLGHAVNTDVLGLDVHDEEHVVLRHHVHAALACSREVRASVFLPGDLRGGVTHGGALQPGCRSGTDTQVHWHLGEGREHWKEK